MPKRLKYKYHHIESIPVFPSDYIFVFGSNLAGLHSIETPLIAKCLFGAEFGVGIGITGRSYALPITDRFIRVLPLKEIIKYIHMFSEYTHNHPNLKFWITDICKNKKMYNVKQIAPLFNQCNANCTFPLRWKRYLK